MTDSTALTESFATRLAAVRAEIAQSCEAAGRSPDEVTLVAVSKKHPAAVVVQAYRAGIRHIGENRVGEAVDKIAAVDAVLGPGAGLRWHMIGHIQSRKARQVTAANFALVHSVDSVKLAEKLSRQADEGGAPLPILLEVNVSGEDAKYGFAAQQWAESQTARESLWNDIRSILTLPGVQVQGVMTMAPIVEDAEMTRPVFAGLRQLRDALRESFPALAWPHLSMGMTDDYPVAIAEGATIVRIGRAIFGPRPG